MTRLAALLGILAGVYKDEEEALSGKIPPVPINELEKMIVEIAKQAGEDEGGGGSGGGGAGVIFHEYDEANSRYDVKPPQLLEEMQSGAQIYFVYTVMDEDEVSSKSYHLLNEVEINAIYGGEGDAEIVGHYWSVTVGNTTLTAATEDDYFIFSD